MIKPFRDRVNFLYKSDDGSMETEYIGIQFDVDDLMFLPYFKKWAMYKGMKLEKEYSLEELGL